MYYPKFAHFLRATGAKSEVKFADYSKTLRRKIQPMHQAGVTSFASFCVALVGAKMVLFFLLPQNTREKQQRKRGRLCKQSMHFGLAVF